MIIYIAGPMTNRPDWNRAAFMRADVRLSAAGHTVLNPARHIPDCRPERISHEQYLRICFAMIDCCDLVLFLPGWHDSVGANAEYDYCQQTRTATAEYADWKKSEEDRRI